MALKRKKKRGCPRTTNKAVSEKAITDLNANLGRASTSTEKRDALAALPEAKKKCNPEEKRFVNLYCRYFNYSRAWRECADRENVSSSSIHGYKMAHRPHVARRIKEQLEMLEAEEHEMMLRVHREHRRIAFSNMKDVLDNDGNLIPLQDMDDDTAAAVQNIKVRSKSDNEGNVYTETDVKLYDKQKSLDSLAKMYGFDNANAKKVGDSLGEFLEAVSDISKLPPLLDKE